jgi:hypothetical protein
MGEANDSRAARAARNQALCREVNEPVREMNEAFDAFLPLGEWICECANEECFETIEMTHEEYEAVRAGGTRFFVKPTMPTSSRRARSWTSASSGTGSSRRSALRPRSQSVKTRVL